MNFYLAVCRDFAIQMGKENTASFALLTIRFDNTKRRVANEITLHVLTTRLLQKP